MLALTVPAVGVAILLALGGCGGPPWTLNKSPNGIDLRWYADDTPSAVADAVAQAHCQSYGKNVELIAYDQDGSA
jgi:hypothetical protein